MKKDTIHIVMTAYNAEKTIERAIKSVENQTMLPDKLIIVNDASTDNTSNIIKKHLKGNINIEYIELPVNLGAGIARRVGIKKSECEYITFLDSDDELTPNAIEDLYKSIKENNTDISIGTTMRIEDETKFIMDNNNIGTRKGGVYILEDFCNLKFCNVFSQGKLYKKEIVDKHEYSELRFQEDTDTLYKWFFESKKISKINKCVYKYYKTNNSLVNSIMTKNKKYCFCKSLLHQILFLKQNNIDTKRMESLIFKIIYIDNKEEKDPIILSIINYIKAII